jgi:hypothetical protein
VVLSSVEAGEFRSVMRSVATGVTVVAADAGGPAGSTVNSFTSASLDPPLVLFCIGLGSRTWPVIERAGCFAVSFLCADQEPLARRFAAAEPDRFAGQPTFTARSGAPVLLERARRALDEFEVAGVPAVLPFHRAVVRDPAFTGAVAVHTRWIETEFSAPLPSAEAPRGRSGPGRPRDRDGRSRRQARRGRPARSGHSGPLQAGRPPPASDVRP